MYHSVRLSFAVDLPFRTALGVVVEQAGLYGNRSGILEPERRPFFRALVFLFGALATLIKALAIQGDRVSSWLTLGFFVPFIVLEFIERLAKRPTLEAARMPTEESLAVIVFKLMVALLATLNSNRSRFTRAYLRLIWALLPSTPSLESPKTTKLHPTAPATAAAVDVLAAPGLAVEEGHGCFCGGLWLWILVEGLVEWGVIVVV